MTEPVIDTPADGARKISVSFSRKISDGNYGSIEATAWVQGEVPGGATVGDTAVLVGDLFVSASSAVLDQLGIGYTMSDNGVIVEEPRSVAVTMTEASYEQAAAKALGATVVAGGGVKVMNPAEQAGPLDDWLIAAAGRDGVTAVWDNRAKAAGTKRPWYTEAVARGAVGQGKDGSGKGYWPPK